MGRRKDTERHGKEFWERIKTVMGGEKPFAWASRVGIPKSTFSHCMNSRVMLPLKHLISISDATGVSLKWLITGELGESERRVRLLTDDEVINELVIYTKKLPANKQAMVRDIIKRIAEEEAVPKKRGR